MSGQAIYTPEEARSIGLRPLAGPYHKGEEWMMNNVIADMRRGGIEHALVNDNGLEVWRTNNGWREGKE